MTRFEVVQKITSSPGEAMSEISRLFVDSMLLARLFFQRGDRDVSELVDKIASSEKLGGGELVQLPSDSPLDNDAGFLLDTMMGHLELWDKCRFSEGDYARIGDCLRKAVDSLADLWNQSENIKDANRMMKEFRRSVPARKLKARREYRTDEVDLSQQEAVR